MSQRSGLFSEISWFQVIVSALAAITAAWIASSLGVAGTLIGAGLGSLVVTLSTAFYGRTLDKGKTLLVQTASGAVVHKEVQNGQISQALNEVAEDEDSPVRGAEVVDDTSRRLPWRTIIATTVIVLAIAIAAMGAYEVVTQRAFGADPDNPRIGNPLGGRSKHTDKPTDDKPSPEPSSTKSNSTPAPGATTPAPTPTAPAPAATTPAPTVPPTAVPTPTGAPTAPAE